MVSVNGRIQFPIFEIVFLRGQAEAPAARGAALARRWRLRHAVRWSVVGMEPPGQVACRVYKRRWFMLALFVLCSVSNALQWIQYAVISNIVMPYYNVGSNAVNWTSMIYMVLYIPLIFPASWLLDKMGLRVYVTAGALGTAIGAWIKVLSVERDRFWVGFLGQSIVGFSQIFILNVPARLAAVWFGPDQVSFACSVGVFGNQFQPG